MRKCFVIISSPFCRICLSECIGICDKNAWIDFQGVLGCLCWYCCHCDLKFPPLFFHGYISVLSFGSFCLGTSAMHFWILCALLGEHWRLVNFFGLELRARCNCNAPRDSRCRGIQCRLYMLPARKPGWRFTARIDVRHVLASTFWWPDGCSTEDFLKFVNSFATGMDFQGANLFSCNVLCLKLQCRRVILSKGLFSLSLYSFWILIWRTVWIDYIWMH